jgi:hypothetical protein
MAAVVVISACSQIKRRLDQVWPRLYNRAKWSICLSRVAVWFFHRLNWASLARFFEGAHRVNLLHRLRKLDMSFSWMYFFFVRGGHLPDPHFLAAEIVVVVAFCIEIVPLLLIIVSIYFLRRIWFRAPFTRNDYGWLLDSRVFISLTGHSVVLRFYCVRAFKLFKWLVQIVLLLLNCLQ